MRWIMRLQEYDLDIRHRKGKQSGNVDGLTRDPALGETPYREDPIERLYDTVMVTTRKQKRQLEEIGPVPEKAAKKPAAEAAKEVKEVVNEVAREARSKRRSKRSERRRRRS